MRPTRGSGVKRRLLPATAEAKLERGRLATCGCAPVDFGDRAAGDFEVADAGLTVEPERVAALGDLVEDGGVARSARYRALEDVLVRLVGVGAGGTDLNRRVEELRLGVDDEGAGVSAYVKDDRFGVWPGDRFCANRRSFASVNGGATVPGDREGRTYGPALCLGRGGSVEPVVWDP